MCWRWASGGEIIPCGQPASSVVRAAAEEGRRRGNGRESPAVVCLRPARRPLAWRQREPHHGNHCTSSSVVTHNRRKKRHRKAKKAKQKHSNRIYGPAPYCLGDLYNMASTMVSTLDSQSPDPKYHGPLFVINNVSNVFFRLSQMSTTFFVSRTPVLPPPNNARGGRSSCVVMKRAASK